jgi:hypothetical protein
MRLIPPPTPRCAFVNRFGHLCIAGRDDGAARAGGLTVIDAIFGPNQPQPVEDRPQLRILILNKAFIDHLAHREVEQGAGGFH